MKKFIVSEVVPNQEYKVEPYDENEAMIKGALNTIQDIVNDIHKELYPLSEKIIRKTRINREENKELFDYISDTDGFEKFKKDFGHEVCDSPILGTHKFINMLFKNYFRFTEKDKNFLNKISDLLHRQVLESRINLFEIFDHLNQIDYTIEQEIFDRMLNRFYEIYWDEENQLDISINVMSPVDGNDTTEFYIVFNSAPKWIH